VSSIVAMTNSRSLISPTTVQVSHAASREIPRRHCWPPKGGPLKTDKATTSLRTIASIALLPNESRLSCGALKKKMSFNILRAPTASSAG